MPPKGSAHAGPAVSLRPGDRLGEPGEAAGWIFGIFLIALAIRTLAWFRTDPVAFDSAAYFEMAARMRAGQWAAALTYPYPPLYAALIAATQVFIPSAETAGLLIALAAGLLVLFPLAAIARTAVGDRAACGAAFLWAIHPYAAHLGVQALTDAPTALFVAVAIWAGLQALEGDRLMWAVGAGAASGLAYLLRPEGIEPALALAALYALRSPWAAWPRGATGTASPTADRRPPTQPRRALRRASWVVAPLAGWAIVASPYVAYISLEAGSITFSKKKSPAALLGALALAPWDQGPRTMAEIAPPAAEDQAGAGTSGVRPPGVPPARSWLRQMAHNVYIFQRPLVNGIHPLILCFGLVAAWRIQAQKAAGKGCARALLVGLLGLHLAALLGLAATRGPAYLGGHHFFLMALYASPLAGVGLAWALAWATDCLRAPRWAPAVALVLLIAVTMPQSVFRRPGRGTAVRPAAAWIRSQVTGTPVIVTHLAKLTYHAGAERVELAGGYDDILHRGRARSAQFVAFYPDLLRQVAPDFLRKLNSADLEFARAFPEPTQAAPDRRLEVYRLRPR